jgi:predicted MFS family arabinose efflux permease
MRLSPPLTRLERRAVTGLGGIFALRLFGLFLILPVFAVYAETLDGYDMALAGLALGIYGLTQGLLQIPYGRLSDRFGRKPVIAAGLLVFIAGSVIAAASDSLLGVILGRALQGAGAIAAAVIAMLSDLTRDSQRTKAMAIVGITVGASFVLSLMFGPLLDGLIGVRGIFWLTGLLAAGALGVLFLWVPTPAAAVAPRPSGSLWRQAAGLLRHPSLLRLDLGIFFLHAALTALFVVVPLALMRYADLPTPAHWQVYLPVMLASAAVMFPLVLAAERRRRTREVFLLAVGMLAVSQALLVAGHESFVVLAIALFIFFVGFNVLEAQLPSLVSRAAPANHKGLAIGIYSTFEFLGAFAGGALGGLLHARGGMVAVFGFSAALMAAWWLLTAFSPRQHFVSAA